jgi:hypothetical protein
VRLVSDADAGATMEPTADEMGAYLAELSAEERGRLRILVQDGKLEDVLRLMDRFETEQMAMYTIVGEGAA